MAIREPMIRPWMAARMRPRASLRKPLPTSSGWRGATISACSSVCSKWCKWKQRNASGFAANVICRDAWGAASLLPPRMSTTAGGVPSPLILRRLEVGCSLQGDCQRFLAVLRSELDSIGGNKFGVCDADEAEHPAQIGFEMFAHRRRRAGAVVSAARDRDDDAFVASQSFRALRAVFEGLAGHQDAVDPGLELAWNREIVHGRAEHHDVGGEKLVQHGLAGGEILLQGGFRHSSLPGGEMRTRQMRQRRRSQVAVDDLKAGRGLTEAIDDRGGNLSADGVGTENTGIDVQKLHGIHPWYKFVTETI